MGTDPLKEHLFPTISADAPPASRQLSKSAQRHSRYSCSIPPPAFLPRPSRPPPLRSLRQPLCVLCVFPLRIPCSPLAPKIFSNHWKMREKFFQSLEKPLRIFQPLESFFPIIGKLAFCGGATRLCKIQGWEKGDRPLNAPGHRRGLTSRQFFVDTVSGIGQGPGSLTRCQRLGPGPSRDEE